MTDDREPFREAVLKTPDEWCRIEGVEILDPDGWRGRNGRPWTDTITLAEFRDRLVGCTMRHVVQTDERAEFKARRDAGLQKRHEQRLENATYTAAEVKVLTEAALRLGRAEVLDKVKPELDALRALWWFMNNDMGVCDGGDHAVLSWAEVTDMNDLHDAVEEIYQEHGYPPKPDATSGRTDPGMSSGLPQDSQAARSPQGDST